MGELRLLQGQLGELQEVIDPSGRASEIIEMKNFADPEALTDLEKLRNQIQEINKEIEKILDF